MPGKPSQRKRPRGRIREKKERHRLFYFFFGSLFLLIPYLVVPQALDRALMPRILALSAILLVTAFSLVAPAKKAVQADYSVLRHWIFPVLAGFLLISLIVAPFSLNAREGIFDLVKTALFLGSTAMGSVLLVRTPFWPEKLSKLAIISAMPAFLIGAVHYVQRVILSDQSILPDGRVIEYAVTATMAHKNIYSVFMALLLPFTLFGIFRFRGKWRLAAVATSILMLLMIVLLKTRSAWLGLGLGIFVASLLLLILAERMQVPGSWRRGILAALILGAIALIPLMYVGRSAPEFSIPGRVYSIIDPKSPHNIHRFTAWQSSVEMIQDHPLTGVGPGNWRIMAPFYFKDKNVGIEAINWARPHNDFLWVFAEKGVAGFILYLLIFILGLAYLVSFIRSDGSDKDSIPGKVFALCLLAGLSAYLVDSFFSFPYERMEIQAMLSVILAAAIAFHHGLKPRKSIQLNRKWIRAGSLIVFGFGIFYGYHATRMETNLYKALKAMQNGQWAEMLAYSRSSASPFRSLDNNGYPVDYYEGLALAGLNQHQQAYIALKKALEQSPGNVWILDRLGVSAFNAGFHEEAKTYLWRVHDILPGVPGVMANLSNIHYSRGEYQQALDVLMQVDRWEEHPDIANNVRMLQRLLADKEKNADSP